MKLTGPGIESCFRLIYPEDAPGALSDRAAAFRRGLETGERTLEDYFVLANAEGALCASLSLIKLQEGAYALAGPKLGAAGPPPPPGRLASLLREAVQRAEELKARELRIRIE